MKSPITGKEMLLMKEERQLLFRKEEFTVVYHYYLCEESKEQFTSTELDDLNMVQLYNQYRAKHNLPFPEVIKAIREKYALPANKMADILGFGTNSYRNYESGEVPSHANAKLILLASDPKKFKSLVEMTESLDENAKGKELKKIESIIQQEENNSFAFEFEDYLLDGKNPNEFTGYKSSALSKLTEMVVYFTEQIKPWKTQLNKFLFYADFLHFKRTGFSISGTQYVAIDMGPVPNNFNSLFEYMAKKDDVDIYATEFSNGGIGEQFKPNPKRKFKSEIFRNTEIKALEDVVNRFQGVSTQEVIKISHLEKAWAENEKKKGLISYKYAFELTQI